MQGTVRSSSSSGLILPLFAAACAVFAVLLLMSSGFGTRLSLWQFRTGFTILKAAGYIGLGCGLLALISGLLALVLKRVPLPAKATLKEGVFAN
jgi:hypothetical protein